MIQSDHMERIVSLENLKAMCEYVSFARDQFTVSKVTRNRVYVTVEGADGAVTAIFPCYPSPWDGMHNPYVVLDIVIKATGANPDEVDPSRYFWPLLECPRLFRDAVGQWQTEQEALATR